MAKTLSTTCWVEVLNYKKFTATILDKNEEIFIVHMTFFSLDHYQKIQLVSFYIDETLVTILSKYSKFADVSFSKSVIELPKHTRVNNYTIDLVKSQQSFYGLIYNLEQVELELLKIYIKSNLANNFICFFKYLAGTLIPFVKKSDSNFWIFVEY